MLDLPREAAVEGIDDRPLPESVSNVMGEMNCAADSVMSTRTSAPF